MSSENAHWWEQTQRIASVFVFFFLNDTTKNGHEFLSHIVRVTGDETWVSFVNVKSKEQSKQWKHTHSPNKPKIFKYTSASQKADGNYFLRQEKRADGRIHGTRDNNNFTSVLQNTKKMRRLWLFVAKGVECWLPVVLLHGNARPHTSTAARTRELLEHFNWELFVCAHVVPRDYHLFSIYRTGWYHSPSTIRRT
jgi:hypothetical protein